MASPLSPKRKKLHNAVLACELKIDALKQKREALIEGFMREGAQLEIEQDLSRVEMKVSFAAKEKRVLPRLPNAVQHT
jgi:hypothetical protein